MTTQRVVFPKILKINILKTKLIFSFNKVFLIFEKIFRYD